MEKKNSPKIIAIFASVDFPAEGSRQRLCEYSRAGPIVSPGPALAVSISASTRPFFGSIPRVPRVSSFEKVQIFDFFYKFYKIKIYKFIIVSMFM